MEEPKPQYSGLSRFLPYLREPGPTQKKRVAVILWSLLCFPVGLWWLWTDAVFTKTMRIAVTALACAFVGFANWHEGMPLTGRLASRLAENGDSKSPGARVDVGAAFKKFSDATENLADLYQRKGRAEDGANLKQVLATLTKAVGSRDPATQDGIGEVLDSLRSELKKTLATEGDAEIKAAGTTLDAATKDLNIAMATLAAQATANLTITLKNENFETAAWKIAAKVYDASKDDPNVREVSVTVMLSADYMGGVVDKYGNKVTEDQPMGTIVASDVDEIRKFRDDDAYAYRCKAFYIGKLKQMRHANMLK